MATNTIVSPTLDKLVLDYLKMGTLDKIKTQCFIQGLLAARTESPPEKKTA